MRKIINQCLKIHFKTFQKMKNINFEILYYGLLERVAYELRPSRIPII